MASEVTSKVFSEETVKLYLKFYCKKTTDWSPEALILATVTPPNLKSSL
jgi:hypothetical protein